MPPALSDVVLVGAAVTNGLVAGLFFSFASAVSPGLRHVDDRTYIDAFRGINGAILNVVFLGVFFTAPLTAIASAVDRRDASAIAGAACSTATFVITITRNVPLNQQLDRASLSGEGGYRLAREQFEAPWNRWNHIRAATSTAALAFLAGAATA